MNVKHLKKHIGRKYRELFEPLKQMKHVRYSLVKKGEEKYKDVERQKEKDVNREYLKIKAVQ